MALTAKQACFVKEYLIDLNATQAAKRAGYSERRAGEIGWQLLQKTTVQEAIKKEQQERSQRTEITADRVLQELAAIAFYKVDDIFVVRGNSVTIKDTDDMDEAAKRAITGVSETTTEHGGTLQVKLADKIRALDLLGKHLGMYVDRTELSGPRGEPIRVLGAEVTPEVLKAARAVTDQILTQDKAL